MASINTPSKSNAPQRRGRKAAAGAHDLNIIFNQAKPFQDLLRFEHDPTEINPAVSIVQEYARAVRLLYIRTRWSKLGLSDWHSEMNILLSARASTFMGLDVWDPLDDFFDTYLFEMEIQPSAELDAQGRKSVKRGLLRQLQDTASRELESCHKELCDLLEGKLSNWRSLDSRLLTFKKQVWSDCEQRGSLCLTPVDEMDVPLATFDMESLSSLNTESMTFTSPPASEYSSAMSTNGNAYYSTPPPSEYASSWTTESVACYTPPPNGYSPMLQPYIC
ncbi:hypothetical protein HBI56_158360 [Parastagonospora nodorum]|uniref:Uncharacterized protein n=1 Tax=Phaeosphaeria nodorum (strain SN15 / ATCC MYA-4574 / FGSC 10173) TaxID=321614 RepID=A0A7U2EWI5_PHANO|nr:hypothetical protein HBH56_189080 [Parastagonospora nodorum]QRC92300.1 hypothetical protein JI435_024340 [Parastagonospora nodorum SN15]KAH3925183.1 hypothetical protein HBH54_184890 [Parastagonospora nodorum]KAH3954358.1 hypothetical protein HBH53_024240 [Parastagonospora nodorum]KAH3963851.1 hypothetical protein HBH51_164080 [Parastagonospora nodorum]